MQVLLEWGDNSLLLTKGACIVGRGLTCHLRFNDPAVSRHHVRITLDDSRLEIEDLNTTNGTRVNRVAIAGATRLLDGDLISIGFRAIRVRIVDEAGVDSDSEIVTVSRGLSWTGEEDTSKERDRAIPVQACVPREAAVKQLHHQICTRCRAVIPITEPACSKCGSPRPPLRTMSVTQRLVVKDLERRKEPRQPVEFPVLYASDSLSFEGEARDLSPGGIFVASELLDHEGTQCLVTMLPDGAPPLAAEGLVCHVITAEIGSGGRPPGMGIRFTRLDSETQQWVDRTVVGRSQSA